MGKILQFPTRSRFGFQPVKATYSVREVKQLFGLSESCVRRWTREGLIQPVQGSDENELLFDFRALSVFRRVNELRAGGQSLKQIEAELLGQMNLFQTEGQLIQLPVRLSPFEQALVQHERGDEDAEALYKQAIEAEDHVADAYCNLGIIDWEKGEGVKAIDDLTLSLKHDPRHFESQFNLGNIYLEGGDLRLARLHYEIAAELQPDFPNVYFNLGLVCAMQSDFAESHRLLVRYKALAADEDRGEADDLIKKLETIALRNSS